MERATRAFLVAGGAAAAAGLAGLVAAPWYYQPRPLTRAMQRTWPDIVFEVDTDEPAIALTFDDGPHPPYTEAVLDTLARYGARATFFVMGEQVERNPGLFRRMVDEGHEVANHFYDGRATLLLTNEAILRSLERTERILGDQNPSRLVRPASGVARVTTREMLRERGYTLVIGSAYTSDCTKPPRAYMRWAFRQMLEPGRILILHDGRKERSRTVDVLPDVLEGALEAGLRPMTVSSLLALGRPQSAA
ncbi:MAG: polysaccharide deacetylase family protein [Dehalococcoidia bacterium]|nr:polysaccharide deacetylase family protein [Dehalococcoidia bacterium]